MGDKEKIELIEWVGKDVVRDKENILLNKEDEINALIQVKRPTQKTDRLTLPPVEPLPLPKILAPSTQWNELDTEGKGNCLFNALTLALFYAKFKLHLTFKPQNRYANKLNEIWQLMAQNQNDVKQLQAVVAPKVRALIMKESKRHAAAYTDFIVSDFWDFCQYMDSQAKLDLLTAEERQNVLLPALDSPISTYHAQDKFAELYTRHDLVSRDSWLPEKRLRIEAEITAELVQWWKKEGGAENYFDGMQQPGQEGEGITQQGSDIQAHALGRILNSPVRLMQPDGTWNSVGIPPVAVPRQMAKDKILMAELDTRHLVRKVHEKYYFNPDLTPAQFDRQLQTIADCKPIQNSLHNREGALSAADIIKQAAQLDKPHPILTIKYQDAHWSAMVPVAVTPPVEQKSDLALVAPAYKTFFMMRHQQAIIKNLIESNAKQAPDTARQDNMRALVGGLLKLEPTADELAKALQAKLKDPDEPLSTDTSGDAAVALKLQLEELDKALQAPCEEPHTADDTRGDAALALKLHLEELNAVSPASAGRRRLAVR